MHRHLFTRRSGLFYLGLMLALVFFNPGGLKAQIHWESIVRASDDWRYLNANAAPPAEWYMPSFGDAAWSQAPGSFGYADDDDSTYVAVSYSLYIRHHFEIIDKSEIDSLLLDIDFDDAFVAYLNGQPVAKSFNVNTNYPAFNFMPSIDREATMYGGGMPSRYRIPLTALKDGENVLAIQGINHGTNSSDFSLAPFLLARIDAPSTVYHELPEWFKDPDAPFISNLPILVIESQGAIVDEPKTRAHLGIVYTHEGMNTLPGTYNDYDGNIGIEIRGASSQSFAKKGYGFETRLENGENNNVSLLGLPPENDWVLHGPYSDKSLIRNVLAYHFAAEMGQYAPRTRLCEVFINSTYRGVYVLTEKIKRDTFRVDVGKLTSDEVSGRAITGGYILSIDKADEHYWVSPYLSLNNNEIRIQYYYPKPDSINLAQQNYIQNFVSAFEHALRSPNYKDPYIGYQPYIDIQSFVDFYLVNELTRNVDGYRISTYLHKDKDRKNRISPLKAGPVWDFNLGFGNADYYSASEIDGWQSEYPADGKSPPFWWEKLKTDPTYFNTMVESWAHYRSGILSDERVVEVIDSLTALLADAQERNFETYPVLKRYIWPNNYVGHSYENEINYLKNWILRRMEWMDGELDTPMHPYSVNHPKAGSSLALSIYPNPVSTHFRLSLWLEKPAQLTITLSNILGQVRYMEELRLDAGEQELHFSPEMVRESMLLPGIYLLNIYQDGALIGTGKVSKQ